VLKDRIDWELADRVARDPEAHGRGERGVIEGKYRSEYIPLRKVREHPDVPPRPA
jgi:hypothetical protein